MQIYTIATPNQKGQIVIPKKMRDALGISSESYLKIEQRPRGVFISPVNEINDSPDNAKAFLELLKRTKGSWADDPSFSDENIAKRRKLELEATEKRKKAW